MILLVRAWMMFDISGEFLQIIPFTNWCFLPNEDVDLMGSLGRVRENYLTPDLQEVSSYRFELNGGGRDLIESIIRSLEAPAVIIEIGCFLCGSTLRWLETTNDVVVIGIDPWEDDYSRILRRISKETWGSKCFEFVDDIDFMITDVAKHGGFLSACAAVKEHGDRFIPVRGYSPQALVELQNLGVEPDIIYIDANKIREDLDEAHRLFPSAVLCGDDWTWGSDKDYPMRKVVNSFAREHGMSVTAKQATWTLTLDDAWAGHLNDK